MYRLEPETQILILDDFSQFRLTIKSMLFKLGAQKIDQAANANEAMKRCLETDYDIIFCDYNLGEGQDGQQFLEEMIHRHMLWKGTLFIMVTAETSSAQVMGAIEYRPDAYLTKPFTAEQLSQRLKRLLTRNQLLSPIHQAINKGNNTLALQECDKVMEQYPNLRFSCLRLKSEILEQYQKYDELMPLYQQVITEQSLLWAELGVGKVHFANGDFETALEHFRTMQENFHRQVSILDWIARCQRELGQIEAAECTLLEAISISPKSVSRQATLGDIAQSLDHHDIAQQAFRKTISEGHHSCLLKPSYYRDYFDNTLQVAAEMGKHDQGRLLATVEAVAKKMERKLSTNPSAIAPNLSALVKVFAATDKNAQANEYLSRLSRALENPECHIEEQAYEHIQGDLAKLDNAGVDQKKLENINTSMDNFQQEIEHKEVRDKSARKINREGIGLAKKKQSSAALERFREAIQLMPHHADYKLNAAQILLTDPELSVLDDSRSEARAYLDAIDLEHSGTRWRLLRKLKGLLTDD